MTTKTRRGFAAMDPEQQRKIARLGDQAAHAKGTAHEFTVEEARRCSKCLEAAGVMQKPRA